jgi:glyoxylase-like metal-dependent hydrolase (beta-lactamase superfamily II)
MSVRLELHVAGSCVHPEHVILRTRSFRPLTFPAMFAILEHEKHGLALFDTGYGEAFFRCTERFPERLYRAVTPVTFDRAQSARAILARRGAKASDVRKIVISHFHGDHVGALDEFPSAELVYAPEALDGVRGRSRIGALMQGFLPGLLPSDFSDRARPLRGDEVPLPPSCAPFERGFDLFGDRSAIAVPLPGHARGQIGLYVEADTPYFLCADACWLSRSHRERIVPHPITRLLVDDHAAYVDTLDRLHALGKNRALRIVPSHCEEALREHRWRPD